MKRGLIIVIGLIIATEIFCQNNTKCTIVIDIPALLKNGYMIYDIHSDLNDSTYGIVFAFENTQKKGLEEKKSYFLTIDRAYEKKDSFYFNNQKIFTPAQVADSLMVCGRKYFRENLFFVLYRKGSYYFLHRAKGEYLYINYKGDDEDVIGNKKKN